jgi:hypothetical protein
MEPRTPPTIETSLKFMAWDCKKVNESQAKIADSLSTIANVLVDLNNNLKVMIGSMRTRQQQNNDLPPF